MEATVDPQPRGPDWMPITPKTGSLFHADSHRASGSVVEACVSFERFSPWKSTSALRPSVAGYSSGSLFELSCGGSFALKLFIEAQASMRVPSIEKCSVDKSRFTLGRSSTAHKKAAATSPSRSRSRFLEKGE